MTTARDILPRRWVGERRGERREGHGAQAQLHAARQDASALLATLCLYVILAHSVKRWAVSKPGR